MVYLMSHIWDKLGNIACKYKILIRIHGDDRVKFIELMTTGQFHDKKSGFSQLCLILNENGCIIDDTIAAKLDNYMYGWVDNLVLIVIWLLMRATNIRFYSIWSS